MKRFLALVIVLALSLPICCFAEESVKLTGWTKHLGGSIEVQEKNGEYRISGINQSYHTAGINITPVIKEMMKGNSSVTVEITADVKVEYMEDPDDVTIGFLVRSDKNKDIINTKDGFKKYYKGSAMHIISDNQYCARLVSDTPVDEDWVTIGGELTFIAPDVSGVYWESLILCFDKMNQYDLMKALWVKDAQITLIDSVAGDGSEYDFEEEEKTEEGEVSTELDDTDTPALPEGNKLLNDQWVKGLGAATVEKSEFNGQTMYKMKGMNSSYASAYLDVYPSIKALIGEDDEVSVWIVLDVRTVGAGPFGMKLRPGGVSSLVNSSEAFSENYKTDDSTFKFLDGAGVVLTTFSEGEFSGKWQRVEMLIEFKKEDFNDEFWTSWNLCFDMMSEYGKISEIQIKNAGIYLIDEYESVKEGIAEPEENKPTGEKNNPIIYRPYGFNKYTATFAEVVDQPLPGEETAGNNQKSEKNNVIVIAATAGAVVVIGAAVVVAVITKKKKKGAEK